MKKLTISFLACTAGICFMINPAGAQMSFVKVSIPEVKTNDVAYAPSPEYVMVQALSLHTTLSQMPYLKQAQEDLKEREADYALAQKKFKALNECNIKRLKDQFKNPEEVWHKITDAYDSREKDLAIYINSAEPSNPKDVVKKTDIGQYSDQEISEMLLHWSLGNEIMTDVYANQDKWGARPAPKSPSFPLWKDQKYFFDKDWDSYYTKVNAFYGVAPQGRPLIDDRKYDYNRADETLAAHNAYMLKLKAAHPERALLLPEELQKGPDIAPRPLPPVQESVLYIGDPQKTHQIFPAWPDPWKKQIDHNFANWNVKGELAKDFVTKSFRVKDEVSQRDPLMQNNRLNVYQMQKKQVDGAAKIVEASKVKVNEVRSHIQNGINEAGLKISADGDMTNPKTYAALQEALKKRKFELMAQIDQLMRNQPGNGTIETVMAALKKDPDGRTYISTENAKNIDQMMLEAASVEALQKEQQAFAKKQRQEQEKPIDEMCLNGGI